MRLSERLRIPYDVDEYRYRVIYGISIAAGLVMLPFSVNNFLQGRIVLAYAVAVVVVVFVVSAIGIYRTGRPPLPPVVMFLPMIAGIVLSVYTQGIIGVLWAFPGVVLFSFIFRRRTANIMSMLVVLSIAPVAYAKLDWPLTLRAVVTLSLVVVFGNIFSRIVDSLRLQLEEQATRDPLTSAYNRRQLDATLNAAAARCRRLNVPATLLAIDLDRFKHINDELGHEVGDRVLKETVAVIRGRIREVDQLFRTGGEEFLVLLSETDRDGGLHVAEQLRSVVAGTAVLPGRQITISVGVAPFDRDDDCNAWLRNADRALYAAKAAGRDRVSVA